jgi:hypothetical protein
MKRILLLSIALLQIYFIQSFAQDKNQNESERSLTICFNSSIELDELGIHQSDQFHWNVKDVNKVLISDDSKGALSDFQFPHSGSYNLEISNIKSQQPENCQHGDQNEVWKITVAPIQIIYNIDQISFSSALNSVNLAAGIEMTIPVHIALESIALNEFDLNTLRAVVQGVDCQILVENITEQVIQANGTYMIRFKLKGSSRPQSYIMIDFINQIGQINSYYHTSEL